jgi:broad specificity phosphatase PhoE
MTRTICLLFILFLSSCKTTTYFIVRHAEKENATSMSSDVPLSAAGQQRAESLKSILLNEGVQQIYSTNYLRTKSTAQPLADAKNLTIQVYDPRDTSFVTRIKTSTNKGNVLIVGHSNTVDDLVNSFMGKKEIAGDLPDNQYGDLFVVKKKGKKYTLENRHFGK